MSIEVHLTFYKGVHENQNLDHVIESWSKTHNCQITKTLTSFYLPEGGVKHLTQSLSGAICSFVNYVGDGELKAAIEFSCFIRRYCKNVQYTLVVNKHEGD